MYRTGALIVNSSKLLLPALAAAAKLVTGVLYIPLGYLPLASSGTPEAQKERSYLTEASEQIRRVYFQVSNLSPLLDVRILLPNFYAPRSSPLQRPLTPLQHDIEVFLSPIASFEETKQSQAYKLLTDQLKPNLEPNYRMIEPEPEAESDSEVSDPPTSLKFYDHIALGGTFDGIHNGHRLLLTQSALITKTRVIVGLADGPLLASKILPELIHPVGERVAEVKYFLSDVKPWLLQDVVPITDVYGPAGYDEELQCLVVSPETQRGGEKVNAERTRKGLKPLVVHTIELVSPATPYTGAEKPLEEKISSSDIRRNKLGRFIQSPASGFLKTYNSSESPYLIGLTGGIATGKSSIFKRLVGKGACGVDCDKLGHDAYRTGTLAHSKIVEEFGEGVLSENGEINRKALGPIVFSDKDKLQRLNDIVWPAIWREVETRISRAHQEGCSVCVVDAAVMLRAGWQRELHELWVTLAPETEVVKRVMARDGLTEEAALKRMAVQPSNSEYVQHANVVFSTQWEPEFTQIQVDRAWGDLKERMTARQLADPSSKM